MSISHEQLHSLTRRDPLSFGIAYVDLLEDKKWDVNSRRWATEIYQQVNPWMIEKYPVNLARRLVITKSTQAGVSTMAMVKMFHFAANWPVRIFYTLPRQQDVLDFVSTRITPMISSSPYLQSKLDSKVDNAHAKKLADSYLFFMELSVEARMMPADALFVDEVDLSNPDFMGTALNRLDASRWKLQMYLSTPTVPNYGIHGLYNTSDMRQWLVKCPKCRHEQALDWEVNLRIVGPNNNPTKVFYGCAKCSAEISIDHIQTGRWVAQHPERSAETVGFHVHQMLTTQAHALYTIFRDPQTTTVEFYRKRLGKPYEIGGGSIGRDDLLAGCFDQPYEFESVWDGKSTYYLGADQGNEIQVVVAKVERDSRRPKIVHVELIPIQDGFRRLAQLMDIYRVRKAVIDGNPNRHEAINMVKQFPGRVLVADYVEQKETWKTRIGMPNIPGLKNVVSTTTIDRTTGFDSLMDSIKKGEWQLPGQSPDLHPDIELLIDHVTALKRDVETRRTASGEKQVFVWRKLRAEHLAHAWLYLKTALEINRGKTLRMAVLSDSVPVVEADDDYRPAPDVMRQLTGLLAEVPPEQIEQYLEKSWQDESYELPFPLSVKMAAVQDGDYSAQDITWVMQSLLADAQRKQYP
jgi:hypothetical protein